MSSFFSGNLCFHLGNSCFFIFQIFYIGFIVQSSNESRTGEKNEKHKGNDKSYF